MNKAILMGRLTRDPEVRYTPGENSFAIARYTLAVDRKIRKDGDATADFINCVVFGRSAEFVEKYFRKGLKITIEGRIQTVKETIGVGVNEKAALSSDKNCPFVYINFDFTLVNKVASL